MAAGLFGTLSYISREANELGLDALPFVTWRAVLATIILLSASMLLALRGEPLPDPRLLAPRQRLVLLAAGLCGAVLNIAIFAAFLRTTIAVVLICFYTFPAIVTVAAVRLYGERLDRLRLAALLLSSAGLVLVVLAPAVETGNLQLDALGVGLALLAAVCQAVFLLLTARGFRPFASLHVSVYVVAAAGVVGVLMLLVTGEVASLAQPLAEPRAWFWIIAGGFTGAAIPTTALLAGMGLIGPTRTAILMTIEPLVGVALAGVLLGERPGVLQLVGGVGVLAAAAILQAAPRAPVPAVPEYTHPV